MQKSVGTCITTKFEFEGEGGDIGHGESYRSNNNFNKDEVHIDNTTTEKKEREENYKEVDKEVEEKEVDNQINLDDIDLKNEGGE